MGSEELAQELAEDSSLQEHYAAIGEHVLAYFITKAENEGNPCVDHLKRIKDEYRDELSQSTAALIEVEPIEWRHSGGQLDIGANARRSRQSSASYMSANSLKTFSIAGSAGPKHSRSSYSTS